MRGLNIRAKNVGVDVRAVGPHDRSGTLVNTHRGKGLPTPADWLKDWTDQEPLNIDSLRGAVGQAKLHSTSVEHLNR